MEAWQGRLARWLPLARREWKQMRWLVPMMYAEIGAPVASTVFAIDAEGPNRSDHGGFGIVGTTVSREMAEKIIVK